MSKNFVERSCRALIRSFSLSPEGKKLAEFYLMNTSPSLNRWTVSAKALNEGMLTFKGKPIGMGTGYRIDAHYPDDECMNSGLFVDTYNEGDFGLGLAEITDQQTWDMMKAGELGPVSVVIHSFAEHCSKCGADLSGVKDPFGSHPCLVEDERAYSVVDSYRAKRVDFVDTPAYPQAGLLEMLARASQPGGISRELCARFLSQAQILLENKKVSESEKIAALEEELGAAKEKAVGLEKTVEALSAKVKANEDAAHAVLVQEAYVARVKVGIADEEAKEHAFLAGQDDIHLNQLIKDAVKVAQKISSIPQSPEVSFKQTDADSVLVAVNERRAARGESPLKELN